MILNRLHPLPGVLLSVMLKFSSVGFPLVIVNTFALELKSLPITTVTPFLLYSDGLNLRVGEEVPKAMVVGSLTYVPSCMIICVIVVEEVIVLVKVEVSGEEERERFERVMNLLTECVSVRHG